MLTITKKQCDIIDFMKLKNYKPFSDWRQSSKTINFSNIFGGSPYTFADTLESEGFTEKACDDYIQAVGLQSKLIESIIKNKDKISSGQITKLKVKYIVVATKIQQVFFETYKGLEERMKRELEYAKEKGYVRTFSGPVRHLPELRFMRFGKDGKPIGDDKQFSRMFSNLKNISANSTIQTMEVNIVMKSIAQIHNYLKLWNLKSRIWNCVYDSIDFYLYKGEEELVLSLIKKICEYRREPFFDIPMEIDAEISDISSKENLEHSYYKKGKGFFDFIDLDLAIDNYNKKNNTNLFFDINLIY